MRFPRAREAALLAASISFAAATSGTSADQPWLDVSLPFEQRLQSFLAQLNETQVYAMVAGDTEVCIHHEAIRNHF